MTFALPGPRGQQEQRLLSEDAIARILAAPQLPIAVSVSGSAVSDVLDFLLRRAVTASLEKKGSAAEQDRAEAAYRQFLEEMRKLNPFDPLGPPRIPLEYQDAMINWMTTRPKRRPRPERPVNLFRAELYTILLASYQALYGREPTTGIGAPVMRFVHAVFREVRSTLLEEPAMRLKGFSPTVIQLAREAWTQPTDDAVRRAIRDMKSSAASYPIAWMMIGSALLNEEGGDAERFIVENFPGLRDAIARPKTAPE